MPPRTPLLRATIQQLDEYVSVVDPTLVTGPELELYLEIAGLCHYVAGHDNLGLYHTLDDGSECLIGKPRLFEGRSVHVGEPECDQHVGDIDYRGEDTSATSVITGETQTFNTAREAIEWLASLRNEAPTDTAIVIAKSDL